MRKLLLILCICAAIALPFAVAWGSFTDEATAARIPHQHRSDPIGALNYATLNHHEVALDVGVSYKSSGLFAMEPVEQMCDDCGGNHPNLYANCEKCQSGTMAACWMNGALVSCSCKCGYLGRCIWIRW